MNTIRIDLHCHSNCSDGALSPAQVAQKLKAASVCCAALTDHDTIQGQVAFKNALTPLGIGCIYAIELTAYYNEKEFHILGYGIDIQNQELLSMLEGIRKARDPQSTQYSPPRTLQVAQAIELLHKSGGIAVLAHPIISEPDLPTLTKTIHSFHETGLDGIELFRAEATSSQQQHLHELAKKLRLINSAGTDFHATSVDTINEPGIDVPIAVWNDFRSALFFAAKKYRAAHESTKLSLPVEGGGLRIQWRSFAFHIVLPASLALILFASVLFFVLVPSFERALIERKRDMIRELTNAAWSILAEAEDSERSGILTKEQAQKQASHRIEAMRYGREGKDYFWIQDTTPRMIMHPYRTDLNGTDLSIFTDPHGDKIFVLFAKLVKEKNEGYVRYVWQWKDDPSRVEPKESYIRLFAPWGWVIGTGLYVYDVQQELKKLEFRMRLLSSAIFVLVVLILLYIMRQSLRLERKRTSAVELLRESIHRYKTLVDGATEGVLFISGTRCRYANPIMLELLDYSSSELELLDIRDIIPSLPAEDTDTNLVLRLKNTFSEIPVPGVLCKRDGQRVPCFLSLRPSGTNESEGLILIVQRSTTLESGIKHGVSVGLSRPQILPASLLQDLSDEILHADNAKTLQDACKRAPQLVQSLLDLGAFGPEIARMLSVIADSATVRLIHLGIDTLGKPPVAFEFIALGSQGRQEQALFTDQDNAIVFQNVTDSDETQTKNYFNALADFVCRGLTSAGYLECKGKSMANNPRWCQPLSTWKKYFEEWISKSDLQEILEFSMFFDFRTVYGGDTLAKELREHIFAVITRFPGFLPHLAQSAIQYKPPMRLFGLVVPTGSQSGNVHKVNLKDATLSLVNFGRLYALQHTIAETNTTKRLELLVRNGAILPSKLQEMITAFELLFRLRLRYQAATMQQGGIPDNFIDPASLGHIESAILRECFAEIDLLQNQIRRDFLGGE